MHPDNCTMRPSWDLPKPPPRGALGTELPSVQLVTPAMRAKRKLLRLKRKK
jgi:hypothetical protein